MSKSKSFFRASARLLVTTALLLGSFFALTKAVLADPAPPGNIDNTATGSFTGETSGTTGTVISNTVTLTVREVAGITVQSTSITDAPAGVPNAGTYQGISGINTGDVVYFDFTVTNVGNDPTKLFIPIPDPAQISGGTLQGNIQIIAVDPDGAGTFASKTLAVDVTTANDTVALLGATDGYIPVNGTVTVRVPVKLTAATGQTVSVILGDTGTNDNSAATQNQPYTASTTPSTNLDVYTVDLANSTPIPATYVAPVSQVPEATGTPANGDADGQRQEASAKGSVDVVAPFAPKLLLVKRITAVNGAIIPATNVFVDDLGTTDDNDPNWPDDDNIYLRGAIAGVSVKPGDELEYTIYFLSAGNADVSNVIICDLIPPLTTFVNNTYGSGLGMAFANSVTATPTSNLTNIADSDKGRFYPAGSTPNTTVPVVTVCNRPNTAIPLTIDDNTDGLVVVEVVKRTTATIPVPDNEKIPFATSPGSPANSYGFVRFQVKVK